MVKQMAEFESLKKEIEVGDNVELKSGSKHMIVSKIYADGKALCIYSDGLLTTSALLPLAV